MCQLITCESCGRDFKDFDGICPHCNYNNNTFNPCPTGSMDFTEFDVIRCPYCQRTYDASQKTKCPFCGNHHNYFSGEKIDGKSKWI